MFPCANTQLSELVCGQLLTGPTCSTLVLPTTLQAEFYNTTREHLSSLVLFILWFYVYNSQWAQLGVEIFPCRLARRTHWQLAQQPEIMKIKIKYLTLWATCCVHKVAVLFSKNWLGKRWAVSFQFSLVASLFNTCTWENQHHRN